MPSDSDGKPSQRQATSPRILPSVTGQDALELDKVRNLHWRLVSRYMDIIDIISRPGLLPHDTHSSWLGKRFCHLFEKLERARTVHNNASRRRPVTRALVESHIKRKLQELQGVYAQVEQSLPINGPNDSALKKWLQETQDSCTRLASTLTSWASVRALLALLWPAVLGLATAWLGADNIWKAALQTIKNVRWSGVTFLFFVTPLAVFTISYASLLAMGAYYRKRRLFLHTDSSYAHLQGPPKNAYELENDLFNCLRKQKNLEAPVMTICLLAFPVMATLWCCAVIALSDQFDKIVAASLLPFFIGPAAFLLYLMEIRGEQKGPNRFK
jgi:hypothetical protein